MNNRFQNNLIQRKLEMRNPLPQSLPKGTLRNSGRNSSDRKNDGTSHLILKKSLFLIFALCIGINVIAQKQKKAPAKVRVDKIQESIPIADVTSVGGFAGDRIAKNKDNYLKIFPIEEYVQFIEQRTHTSWDWKKAEQPGKWIESALLTALRTGDKELEQKVREMYIRILNSQEPEGYIGATDPKVRTPQKPLRGMDAYELYFLQHALLTVYEQWHDPKALEASSRLADYFLRYIGPGKAEFWPSKERYPDNKGKVYRGTVHSDLAGHSLHYSWEGTLLIDPMLRLYQLTGDNRYLDWCKWVISNIDKWSGWDAYSNLNKVANGTMKINEIQPYVHAHTFHMNFLGFLRMYQLTGDVSYLRKVAGAWDDIAERQMYITGGVAVGEHYERDYIKPLTGKMVETCATMSWLQLSQYLLELTGNTRYADAMERLIWNHVFAAQTIDGNCSRYDTPPNGVKPEGYFHGPDCCTGSGHRLMSILPTFIYSTGDDNTLYVNQFVKSEANIKLSKSGKLKISQLSDYPVDEKVVISVNPEKATKFTVKVRVPEWCISPTVLVNGKPVAGIKSGEYAVISRKWKSGDEIEMRLPMQVKWVRREHHMNVSDRKPYPAQPDPDPPFALLRGPIVYSVDNIWHNGNSTYYFPQDVMNDVRFVLSDPLNLKQIEAPREDMLGPGYLVPVELKNGERAEMKMFPFANTGIWYKDEAHKPDLESKTYSYAIWLKGFRPKDFHRRSVEEGKGHLEYLSTLYANKSSWKRRKKALKDCILSTVGLNPIPESPGTKPIVTEKRVMDGYTVENIAIETLPGLYVCGSLYRPTESRGPFPVVLSPNGHFADGRYRPDQQYRCATLARMGAIAFSYDLFAWGESRLQFKDEDHRNSIAHTIQALNSIRILDYLTSLEEADPERVAITGGSGGGSQTMLIAALDERIKVSVPVVMVSSHFSGGCPCESGNPIHLCEGGTNNAEIAAMAAPRPQLIITDGKDWSHTVPELEFPFIQRTYGFYGKSNLVKNVHFADEGHDYGFSKRKAMYEFLAEHLGLDLSAVKNEKGEIDESRCVIEEHSALYVFGENGNLLPPNAIRDIEQLEEVLRDKKH